MPVPSTLLCFCFGLISLLCDTYGRPDCFVSLWSWRFVFCDASDWSLFAGRMTAESNKGRRGKRGNITTQEDMASRPKSSSNIDNHQHDVVYRTGTDNPIAISPTKKNHPSFCILLSAVLLFGNRFGRRTLSAYLSKFSRYLDWRLGMLATKGAIDLFFDNKLRLELSENEQWKVRRKRVLIKPKCNKNRHHRLARPFHHLRCRTLPFIPFVRDGRGKGDGFFCPRKQRWEETCMVCLLLLAA